MKILLTIIKLFCNIDIDNDLVNCYQENNNQYSLFVILPVLIIAFSVCYQMVFNLNVTPELTAAQSDVVFLINALDIVIQSIRIVPHGLAVNCVELSYAGHYANIKLTLLNIKQHLIVHQDIKTAFTIYNYESISFFINYFKLNPASFPEGTYERLVGLFLERDLYKAIAKV
jgi:hypothetical protein